ncbi:MAG: glycosyltransferase [Actinobacteria bacterium]|nr:glycosyltransferase [Actinomycetota bacterium]
MAAIRLHEHSRQARTNVDVVIDGWLTQRRWLAATPDTYRVRGWETFGPAPDAPFVVASADADAEIAELDQPMVVVHDADVAADDLARLARPLADPDIDVSVLGEVPRPRLLDRRRVEPDARAVAVAVRTQAWREVGGLPAGHQPLPGFVDRLRAAGRWFALIPIERTDPGPALRTDPVVARRAAVVLALVPMHDVGGGSRGAQLARELLRWGFHVTYVALYGTAESTDLGLRYIHPALEQVRANRFDVDHLSRRLGAERRLVVVEVPHRRYLQDADRLRRHGFEVVYDLIDDWSAPSLGGDWYAPHVEDRLARLSDVLIASAEPLRQRLQERTSRPVTLVPNAVNAELFSGDVTVSDDLPTDRRPVIGYHGSLYGDWFDWAALRAVAESFARGCVVVIGDAPDDHPPMPANVRFVGLKPQEMLAGYLAAFDVGVIPFVVSPVTHAVSPLKVYEYLAMGVPVAAPPLRALAGLDGVHVDEDLVAAVQAALVSPRPNPRWVLEEHSWTARVRSILAAAGWPPSSPGEGHAVETVVRGVRHHARRERSVEQRHAAGA